MSSNPSKFDEGAIKTFRQSPRGPSAAEDTHDITNHIHASNSAKPTRIRIAAGNATVSANMLENAVIEVDDQTGADLPIHIQANVLQNSQVVCRKGNLIDASGPAAKK